MPKNFVIESIRHHLLRAFERVHESAEAESQATWDAISQSFDVLKDGRTIKGVWTQPTPGEITISRGEFELYQRGDLPTQTKAGDPELQNTQAANALVAQIGERVGISVRMVEDERFVREEAFHDDWAADVSPEEVMVDGAFEACTAPEHRFILEVLGDIHGKKLLDLGCGLGEASVYFAKQGADVTASDLSGGMLDISNRVASHHNVKIALQQGPAEATGLPENYFDIVYTGNLLHHVDTAIVLDEIMRVLKPGGMFISWDPLAHNPVINVYRQMASAVRTVDEHPLRMKDLDMFRSRFTGVNYRCFWLFTLVVFLRFYFWERVHPSKERYWKKILVDAPRLASFYGFFETLDRGLLAMMPWLGRYCWNIVIWGHKK